jgi:predicted DNA-binding protein
MAAELSDRVRAIAEARGLPESEVFERALERGLDDLWDDLVLAQYLDDELDRQEAIDRVGRTKVERAEREREIVEEDVDWGLQHGDEGSERLTETADPMEFAGSCPSLSESVDDAQL